MPLLHASSPGARETSAVGGPSRRLRRAAAALMTSVVLVTTATSCSTDGSTTGGEKSGDLEASDLTATDLKVPVDVSRVHGKLSPRERVRLEREAGELLSGYFSAAYLHARQSAGYRDSFPGFTAGARRLALRDVEIASDGAYAWAEEVEPLGAVAFLSVVAPEGRPVGATARVLLRLAVSEGGKDRRVTVRGRLLLTPAAAGLQIFGYDLSVDSTPQGRRNR